MIVTFHVFSVLLSTPNYERINPRDGGGSLTKKTRLVFWLSKCTGSIYDCFKKSEEFFTSLRNREYIWFLMVLGVFLSHLRYREYDSFKVPGIFLTPLRHVEYFLLFSRSAFGTCEGTCYIFLFPYGTGSSFLLSKGNFGSLKLPGAFLSYVKVPWEILTLLRYREYVWFPQGTGNIFYCSRSRK